MNKLVYNFFVVNIYIYTIFFLQNQIEILTLTINNFNYIFR